MKRLLSFLLLAAMICCFSSSFSEAQEPADQPWCTGITLTLPESMTGAKGTVIPSDDGELTLGSGIYLSELFYVPIASEAFNSIQERILQIDMNDQEAVSSPENEAVIGEYMEMIQSVAPVCTFVTVSGKEIEAAFAQYLPGVLDSYEVHFLGTLDEYRYYMLVLKKDSEEYQSLQIPGEFRDEYELFISDPGALTAGVTLGKPLPGGSAQLPDLSSLEFMDLDGNPVDPAEIFAQHQVTMVNIWATYCGYCITEFPELEQLNLEMAKQDCAIIGVCTDISGSDTAPAREILDECGVTYLNLVVSEKSLPDLFLQCVPTSFFISREGSHVTEPVYGAVMDAYREKFSEALRQDAEKSAAAEKTAQEASGTAYTVQISDQNGDPVAEASVSFCDDSSCILRETDENGLAVLEGTPAKYHLQVVDVPEGYAFPAVTNFEIGPESGTIRLQVPKE